MTATEVRNILDAMERLFSAPNSWCQGAAARDKRGFSVFNAVHPDAVSWCLSGGLSKVTNMRWDDNAREVRRLLRKATLTNNIAEWNDRKVRQRQDILNAIHVAKALVDA